MKVTVQIQADENLQQQTTVSQRLERYESDRTDCRGDLRDGGQEEPNQTL
jgi:hypothetical protein